MRGSTRAARRTRASISNSITAVRLSSSGRRRTHCDIGVLGRLWPVPDFDRVWRIRPAPSVVTVIGSVDAYGQASLWADHGFSSMEDIPSDCRSPRWRQTCTFAFLCRAIWRYGVRTTDVSRKSSRHRGLSRCASVEALSHGLSQPSTPFDTGRRQRAERLANIVDIRSPSHQPSAIVVCAGHSRYRSRQCRVRAGIRRRSICVYRYFPGRRFARRRPP